MPAFRLAAVTVFCLLLLVPPAPAAQYSPQAAALAKGNAAFACDLYRQLKKAEKGNLFFSPFSISTALAMTYGGAAGDTAAGMGKALRLPFGPDNTHPAFAELLGGLKALQESGDIQFSAANSLWPGEGYPLREAYLALLKTQYGTDATPLDYRDEKAARARINAWVAENTKDNIRDLLAAPLAENTKMVLVNAVYFKGGWATPFDRNRTEPGEFSARGKKIPVSFMRSDGAERYAWAPGLQILELFYAGGDLSMLILLPADKPGALEKLESRLNPENLDDWQKALRDTRVKVFLPRFKVSWGAVSLKPSLRALGMDKAFDNKADFSAMSEGRLLINDVLHKAVAEVNEEGAEAAAATAVAVATSSGPISAPDLIPEFRADRPFLFLIRENAGGSILFLGRVSEPEE